MKTRFSAGKRVLSRIIVLTMAFSMAITASAAGPTTTVGDGTSPGNKFVTVSSKNQAVSSFTLSTNSGTDTVTGLVVTGTNTANVAANGVNIWRDNGSTPNEWDATDALMGTGSFSGTTATLTGLTITETTAAVQYIITYDLKANPTYGSTLTGRISGISVSGTVINNDDVDATLTVDTYPPGINFSSPSSSVTKSGPVTYTISYTGSPSSGELTISNITLNKTGTADGTVALTGNRDIGYKVTISSIVGDGKLGITVAGGIVSDAAGNSAAGGTSSTFTVDNTAPTVTINQAVTQADPASTAPINFTVVFSEPVINFTAADVTIGGTAAGTTAIVTGSGATYNVAMSGMTSGGTVVASIAAGVANDAAGNLNTASTSTDNTVALADQLLKYDPNGGTGTISDSVKLAGTVFNLTKNTFTRTGYTFAGWSTIPAGAAAYADEAPYTMPVGGATLYAKWIPNTYTVTWDIEGTTSTTNADYGTIPSLGSIPAKAATEQFTYTFAGWSATPGGTVIGSLPAVTVDVTYYAIFNETVNSYTVTFKDWNGAVISSQTVAYGSGAAVPTPSPSRLSDAQYNYEFAGWDVDFSVITGNLTVVATYNSTVRSYTVDFKNWNGDPLKTQLVPYGSGATAPANPTRPSDVGGDYIFTGWDVAFNNITGNLTVTAMYNSSAATYTVTFKNWNGDLLKTESVASGSAATAPTSPPSRLPDAQYNYAFTGWDVPFVNVTGNLTVTAQYSAALNNYTVTFKNWSGVTLKTESVTYGSAATAPIPSPDRAADEQFTYTFSGWDVAFNNITGNLTVTAQYNTTLNNYTVTFTDWNGDTLKTQSVAYGFGATAPTNFGRAPDAQYTYEFSGWSAGFSNITGNLTVKAQYTATLNNYTVTFKDWEGTILSTQSVPYGSAATAPASPDTMLGYHFTGWSASFANITANLELTAVYAINMYTVTFKNWEDVTLKTESVAYGSAATAPTNTSRTADAQFTYTFIGWDAAFDNITGALTVTAQYSSIVNNYTVTFKDWDGTTLKIQNVTYGSGAAAPAEPTRAPDALGTYTFTGWDVAFNNIIGNLTVTAQYSTVVNKYTVTWMNGTSQLEQDTLIPAGTQPDYNGIAPTKDATAQFTYTFDGWSTNPAATAGVAESALSAVTADVTYYAVFTAAQVGGGGGSLGGGGGGGAPSGGGGGGSFGGGGGGGVLGANSKVYNDVQQGDWYYEAVQYVVNAGLFSGTTDTTFEPNTIMTRGMIVTVLYSLEGKPAISAANPFKDVKSGMWYANAVVWAAHNGIVGGYTSTTFGPNDKLTREQLAVILYNYAAYKHYDMTLGNNVNLQSYTDASKITSYAKNAVKWAYGAGIMLGKTSTTLAPKDNASRAEVAKVFMMLMTTVVN